MDFLDKIIQTCRECHAELQAINAELQADLDKGYYNHRTGKTEYTCPPQDMTDEEIEQELLELHEIAEAEAEGILFYGRAS